jgi:hypothetical protein
LPITKTITPNERRHWLDLVEQGTRIDEIARASGQETRTMNSNIESARRVRDFSAAQRGRLGDAINAHRQEMLGLLERISSAAVVPDLN